MHLAALLMDAAFFCAWAAVPFLVKVENSPLRLNDFELGQLRSVTALTYVFGTLVLSKLWVSRNHVMLARVGACLTALFFLLASISTSPLLLFVLLPMGGLSLSLFWPNLMSLIGSAPDKSLVVRLATFNCWWSTGKALAFLLAGTLLQTLGPVRTMQACGILLILPFLLLRTPREKVSAEPQKNADEIPGRESCFHAALVGIFCAWFLASVWENQFPKGLGAERYAVEFGETYKLRINLLLFSLNAGQAFAFYLLRIWTAWPGMPRTISLAVLVLLSTSALALLALPAWLLTALLFLMGMASALIYSQSLYHAQAGRGAKVRRSGIHEGVVWLGPLTGPFLAGYAVEATGSKLAAFGTNAAICLLCLLFVIRKLRPRSA